MPALYMTSRAYSWAFPALSEDDRRAVIDMMRIRGGQAFSNLRGHNHLWRPYSSHSNRAWHFLGEVAIAFIDDIPEAPTWLDYAMTIFYTCYPVWGDADGGWHEGAAYWSSYNARFMYWAFVARSAFDIDVFERPFYQRIGDYGMYLMPPGTQTGGFGDQAPLMSASKIAPLMAVLANGARNPHWRWYAEACGSDLPGGYLGFIYAANAIGLDAKPPADLPTSTVFRGVGLAVLNSNLIDGAENVQVQFKSSPLGRQSHGYNANNAFLLNMRGQPVLVRTGKRDVYGSKHHTDWMWDSKSDNCILVNGEGQTKHTAAARGAITAFQTSEHVDVVIGEAADSYPQLDRFTRQTAFFKPHAVLIHDVLEAKEPSIYQWTLHGAGAFEIGDQSATWQGEPGSIEVRFLSPGGLAISQTDQFDPPPADWSKIKLNQWHLTAATSEKASSMEFLTLIGVDDAPVEITQTSDGMFSLSLPEGTADVRVGPEIFSVRGLNVIWGWETCR